MPAQRRSSPENNSNGDEEQTPSPPLQNGHRFHPKQSHLDSSHLDVSELHQTHGEDEELDDEEDEAARKPDDDEEDEQEEDDDEEEDDEKQTDEDSEGSESFSSEEDKPEYTIVPDIRINVQCPICLGIIKNTRTVMGCLHRFCRGCIDKSMRLGNNECPACRTHCPSRRSLRDDPTYDTLIAAVYPDIDKYEEKELAFHEEERTRNKQIQASIAQIFQRQTEALVRRKSTGKEIAGPSMTGSQRYHRSVPSRKRRNSRVTDFQGSEDIGEEDDENGGKDSSSADERSTEVRHSRRKRRTGIRISQPTSSEGGPNEYITETTSKENRGTPPGLVSNTEMLAWGRGGARSHTRHGNPSSSNGKNSRNTRLSRLVKYLRSLEEKNDELDVHLMLISLEKQSAPNLQQPYLCCRPSLSVKHLCEYVALQTPMQAKDIEISLVKGQHKPADDLSNLHPPISMDELQILKEQETLAGVGVNCTSNRDRLILAYRQKERTSICLN